MTKHAQGWETTSVLICGGGPTGATLSAYLGRISVKNIVLEKDTGIYPYPRAFNLGESAMRLLQGLGLCDHIYTDMDLGYVHFTESCSKDLNRTPFLRRDSETMSGYTGHTQSLIFKQPLMERYLRSIIAQDSHSDIRVGCTIISVEEDEDWVYVVYQDESGTERHVRSKFLVGADGKKGYVRKNYLEPKGVRMDRTHSYEEVYISLQYEIVQPTPKTHPDFPLWKVGFTPQQAVAAFFPAYFTLLSTPGRPGAASRIALTGDNPMLWRFEFATHAGEDPEKMAKVDVAQKEVSPFFIHKGSRYGLRDDVQFPSDCLKLLLCVPYRFAARTCNQWHVGRVMLAGDAAHVFPPFGGQGLQCGMLDASGLAWRLAIAIQSQSTKASFDRLLTTWSMERKQHVNQALAYTVRNGDIMTETSRVKIFIRNWYLWLMQITPSWKQQMERGIRPPAPRYTYEHGMAFLPEMDGGITLPQIYCVPLDPGNKDREVAFSDDFIYAAEKTGLIQLIVLVDSLEEVRKTITSLNATRSLSPAAEVLISEATYLVHDYTISQPVTDMRTRPNQIMRIATVEEFQQSKLSAGRPKQEGYDAFSIKQAVRGKRFVVVRPDRFVFAACAETAELETALKAVERVLRGEDA